MALTKASLFKENHIQTAELAKALSHPARLAIVVILSQRESCICNDITNELPLAQSTISQHLKTLKRAGIIKSEINGIRTCYCLDHKGIKEINKLFTPFTQNLITAIEDEYC